MASHITHKPSNKNLEQLRHSLAHLLAAAVMELWPDTRRTIGPAIEDGFYYDFQFSAPITVKDLPKVEARMKKILQTWTTFERRDVTKEQAKAAYKDNPFKLELVDEFSQKGEKLTFYKSGNYEDLCRGGHVASAREIKPDAFKLTKMAGAYWRGSEKNPMLTRIYGVAFSTKTELDAHLKMLEEAAKRDHRKIGKDLDLFSFHDIAPGAPFWHPNGMVIVRELERFWREIHDAMGYQETSTPIMNNAELYKTSGHWDHFRQNMFTLRVDEQDFALKPMNCPSSTKIYSSHTRSYRDLPLRLSEIGRLHRNEIRGSLGGLFRVRQITMDDAHIFCRPDQIEKEVGSVFQLVTKFYKTFKLAPRFVLSTRPEKFLGKMEQWDDAEQSLQNFLKKSKVDFTVMPGEGAFYGPKIDISVTDSLKREWQLATIQLDFQMPERFALEYIDKDGSAKRPVMVHRAIFGSFERFLGILLEHTGGNLPMWLSPVQVQIIPVSEKFSKVAEKLGKEIASAGTRVHVDDMNESVGKKIRNASIQKVPYVLVIGEKEAIAAKLSVRIRGMEKLLSITKKQFVERVKEEIVKRK